MGLTTGYGRLPLLALVWMLGLWAAGAVIYAQLDRAGAMRPNAPVVLRSPEWVLCATPRARPRCCHRLARSGRGSPAGGDAAVLLPAAAGGRSLSEVQRGDAVGGRDHPGVGQRAERLLVARYAHGGGGYWGKWFMYVQGHRGARARPARGGGILGDREVQLT